MVPLHQAASQSLWLFLHFSFLVLSSLVVSVMGWLRLSAVLPLFLLQVFHYYTPALDLIQLVNLADLPSFLVSRTECDLYPLKCVLEWVWGGVTYGSVVPWPLTKRGLSGKSVKAKLLLDQLTSLRGKVTLPQAQANLSSIISMITFHFISIVSLKHYW